MHVSQVSNRRLRKAKHYQQHLIDAYAQKDIWNPLAIGFSRSDASLCIGALKRYTYYLDQQSARLASYLHIHCGHKTTSFAGVPMSHCLTQYEGDDDGHYSRHPNMSWSGSCRSPDWIAHELAWYRRVMAARHGPNWLFHCSHEEIAVSRTNLLINKVRQGLKACSITFHPSIL